MSVRARFLSASKPGQYYFVDLLAKTCTCPGYKQHHHCKHYYAVFENPVLTEALIFPFSTGVPSKGSGTSIVLTCKKKNVNDPS